MKSPLLVCSILALAVAACGPTVDELKSVSPVASWEGAGLTNLDPSLDPDGARFELAIREAPVGQPANTALRVRNSGATPLRLVETSAPSEVSVSLPGEVPQGGDADLEISVLVQEAGPYRFLVDLGSNDPFFPVVRVRVIGRAISDGGDEEPDDPAIGDPNLPEEDDPADPGEGDPSDPGEDDPADPGEDDPSDPGDDDPADPGDDEPADPAPACWEHSDAFTAERKIDVLWVIDNSASVQGAYEVSLWWSEFVAAAAGVDYQVGVTTTGLSAVSDVQCPGGASGGENGRLFPVDGSSPRVIDASMSMADQDAAWRVNSQVGYCHFDEQPYEAARRALSSPLVDHADDPRTIEPDDGNLGFLRADADLAIVSFTDELDQSTGHGMLPSDYVAFFQSLKPGAPESVRLHAITGPRVGAPRSCSASHGDRLIYGVDATGGTFHSICTPLYDWPAMFLDLSRGVFDGVGTTFRLAEAPDDDDGDGVVDGADLVVRVDGVLVSPLTPLGELAWQYDSGLNAIRFEPPFRPAPGSSVSVDYRVPCPESD